jgi:oxygen-independent coproporphyrinogen-3 oxidase
MNKLAEKYNQSGPRYTSYPPVPFWNNTLTTEDWKKSLAVSTHHNKNKGINLYIHLPFCESLCTYCGCNTRITTNHGVESPYIDAVLKEWNLYRRIIDPETKISELHIGGGTPTFFSAANLDYLLTHILERIQKTVNFEFSIEGHPNSTSESKLKILSGHGFRRISYGIQDFDPKVQKAIHRFQTVEQVDKVTRLARENRFDSVNYDLIYGLPFQTIDSVRQTFDQVLLLRPDRIAFYGYAHVPWVKPGQRSYSGVDLPKPADRLAMYEAGRAILENAGYMEIGMDHFALATDSLFLAQKEKKLHRNFMGYTNSQSDIIIGLGVSSIGEDGNCYAQNVKTVEEYYSLIDTDTLPVFKGHILTEEQKNVSKHVRSLMCSFETKFEEDEFRYLNDNIDKLIEMQNDGILTFDTNTIRITRKGRRFVRNVCMAIDPMIVDNGKQVFSATV